MYEMITVISIMIAIVLGLELCGAVTERDQLYLRAIRAESRLEYIDPDYKPEEDTSSQ